MRITFYVGLFACSGCHAHGHSQDLFHWCHSLGSANLHDDWRLGWSVERILTLTYGSPFGDCDFAESLYRDPGLRDAGILATMFPHHPLITLSRRNSAATCGLRLTEKLLGNSCWVVVVQVVSQGCLRSLLRNDSMLQPAD